MQKALEDEAQAKSILEDEIKSLTVNLETLKDGLVTELMK